MTWSPSELLSRGISYGLFLHKDQRRKGASTPYIGHLLSVAGLVIEFGGDEEQAVAGMLHDAIEDQGIDASAIKTAFGTRIARIVLDCTDSTGIPKLPWRQRKEAYIAHLREVSPDTLLVSCCDKLHNARAILTDLTSDGPKVFSRFAGDAAGVLWYYGELAKVFSELMPGPLSQELLIVVRDIEKKAGRHPNDPQRDLAIMRLAF